MLIKLIQNLPTGVQAGALLQQHPPPPPPELGKRNDATKKGKLRAKNNLNNILFD